MSDLGIFSLNLLPLGWIHPGIFDLKIDLLIWLKVSKSVRSNASFIFYVATIHDPLNHIHLALAFTSACRHSNWDIRNMLDKNAEQFRSIMYYTVSIIYAPTTYFINNGPTKRSALKKVEMSNDSLGSSTQKVLG